MIRPGVEEMVAFLNSLVELDREWIQALATYRPACNAAVRDHPTVQVREAGAGWASGLVGLLNGYFGVHEEGNRKGHGPIVALYADRTQTFLGGFKVLEEADLTMPAETKSPDAPGE